MAACLPSGMGIIAPNETSAAAPIPTVRAPAISIFLDVSGSMAGYVARARPSSVRPPTARPPGQARVPGSAAEPRTFNDLVQSLPQVGTTVADRIALFSFGSAIKPLALSDLGRATRPEFFGEQDSRIQDALARMDALPADEIGLLVTDLFLTGDEIFGGASAIRAPLARLLESGRAIALMGIRSGFAGTIYDIPFVRTYAAASERPFYLLASGPAQLLARLMRRIETELLAPLSPPPDGQPRYHAVLFTHTPLPGGPAALTVKPREQAQPLPPPPLDLPPDIAAIRFPAAAGAASAEVPIATLGEPYALLPDRFRIEQSLWLAPPRNSVACPDRWVEARSFPAVFQLGTAANGAPMLTIGGPSLGQLTPNVFFLARARIIGTGLSDAPVSTAWVRAWNLETREAEAYVATRPQMFRTLNLREIVSMLEGLVRDRMTSMVVGDALVVLQVSRR